MTSLRRLVLGNNVGLGGPVPRFWANHPALISLYAPNCGFTGTLPASFTSRRLFYVDLSQNQICGSIFEVPQPRGFTELHLENNLLSGTFPASWAQSLTVKTALALYSNRLNGTIPSPPLSTLSTPLTKFQVSTNHFHGPVPDFSDFHSLSTLWLADTSLDLCELSPNITVTSLSCSLSNVAVDACNCSSNWTHCSGFSCSSPAPPAAIIDPTPAELVCVVPADRPTAGPVPPLSPRTHPTAPPPPTHTSTASPNLPITTLQIAAITACMIAFGAAI